LKRFNEKILKVEELLEPIFLEALIDKGKEHTIWRKLYALLDKSLLKVKQVMTNYIWVEEANILGHKPFHFYKDNRYKKFSK
jgi:hypothetical protein